MRNKYTYMTGKRAITPVIAIILLIVMTVGIAALTFVWMQNFVQGLQQQSQQTVNQLQKPQFTIATATANNVGNATNPLWFINVTLANVGSVSIDTKSIIWGVRNYSILDNSYIGTVGITTPVNCYTSSGAAVTTLKPGSQAICDIELKKGANIDFTNYYYVITATYKGVTAQYNLRG